ncbi:uncharacterized protein [Musca autumnalis]|uniref:uncharacterized protein n=1 Tax=Musca autumnalis TaxID=221902 RepID=UPI003CEAE0D0
MCENNVWQAPQWLSHGYLQQVLKGFLRDNTVQLTNVDIRPATANGENYASVMSRIKISFTSKTNTKPQTLSFIMKYSYENDPVVSKIMSGYDIYNTEMKMYEQILPQLAEILKESGDTEKLFAHTLKVDNEKSAIIFEDLTVEGYEMADRKKGLDYIHMEMCMQKLAKFHAAAAVLNERQGGLLEQFDHGMFNRHTKGFGCVFEYFTKEAAHFAKNCPELGEYYSDKLLKLTPHIVDYCTKAYASSPWNFYSLSHGDLWTNNIMMLYDKSEGNKLGSLKDMMLIDFQLCNWSSVAVDLHYLFNTSLESKLLVDNEVQEKLIQYYHSVLSDTLKKLKFKGHISSLHEITVQLEESRILALNGVLAHRSIMTTGDSDDADIHSLLDDDERARKFRRNCFTSNKEFQNVIKKMLPLFDRHGLLDLQKQHCASFLSTLDSSSFIFSFILALIRGSPSSSLSNRSFIFYGNMCENNVWQAPQWLSHEYLQQVLKEYLKDNTVQLTNVDIRPATANGENYASVMIRIKISFISKTNAKPQTLSFIMKYSFENDPMVSKIMSDYDMFDTEMKMYEQILPQLAEILRESGDTEKLFAQTLKVDKEKTAIIFEDLTVEGYELADRIKGLDFAHMELCMQKLAKFHAAAAVLNERQGGLLEQFDHGMFNHHTKGFGCIFEYFTEEAAHFAKNCLELGEYYSDKLVKLTPHIVDYCTKAYSPNPRNFYSLNHGDLWTNNIMMLYDKSEGNKSGSLKNTMLIDFQMCDWSSVAVDLHFLFNTSLESKLLVDSEVQEKLIQYYHSILSDTLKKLKFKGHIPSLHEITVQLEESRIIALNALLGQRSILTTGDSDDADFHSLLDDDERARNFRRNCFTSNKEFQDVIKKLLPLFDRHGLLDLQT